MKYLITGGAGFIGSHLCDALINRGDSVLILDNLSTGTLTNISHLMNSDNFEFINGSILDTEAVNNAVKEVDYIIHLAAAVGVFNIVDNALDSLKTNLNGTENLLEAASQHKKPFLLASTSEIYGKNTNVPLSEESDRVIGSPLKSRWSYSEAKAIDESLAYFYFLEKSLEVKIVRLFNTVGPRQIGTYGMVVPRFIENALKESPLTIYGSGKQSRCFCHVDDAVRALLGIIDAPNTVGEVFNIGNTQEITIEELALEVKRVTKSKSEISYIPYEIAYAHGFEDMQRRIPNINKIYKFIGWQPKYDLEKIILDIADCLKVNSGT